MHFEMLVWCCKSLTKKTLLFLPFFPQKWSTLRTSLCNKSDISYLVLKLHQALTKQAHIYISQTFSVKKFGKLCWFDSVFLKVYFTQEIWKKNVAELEQHLVATKVLICQAYKRLCESTVLSVYMYSVLCFN